MRTLFIFMLIAQFFFSCTTAEITEVNGKWTLIEQLADPGDGSGTFETVNSNKTIEFLTNGNVVSNGDICLMTINTEGESSGTYSTEEKHIIPNDCNIDDLKILYEIIDSKLILHFQCIEQCSQKYIKFEE